MGILVALPIAAAIAILDRRKIEEFIFLAIGVIISLIFATGYMGNTLPGVYLGIVCGVIAFVYCINVYVKDRERFRESVLTPGLWGSCICILFATLLLAGSEGFIGSNDDKFRVYLPQVANMYQYSTLGAGIGSENFELLYCAPICPAWCYFSVKLWPVYTDWIISWSRQIFVLSSLFPLFSMVRKNEKRKIIYLSIVVTLILNIVDNTYGFYNDVPVGGAVVYGLIMTMNLCEEKKEKTDIAYLLACCWSTLAICMLKRFGCMFIYVTVSIPTVYCLDILISNKNEKKKVQKYLKIYFCIFVSSLISCIYRALYAANGINLDSCMPVVLFVLFTLMGGGCYFLKRVYSQKNTAQFFSVIAGSITVLLSAMLIYLFDKVIPMEVKSVLMDFADQFFFDVKVGNSGIPDVMFVLLCMLCIIFLSSPGKKRGILSNNEMDSIKNVGYVIFSGYVAGIFIMVIEYMRQGRVLDLQHTIRYYRPGMVPIVMLCLYMFVRRIKECTNILLCFAVGLMIVFPQNFMDYALPKGNTWDTFRTIYRNAGVTLTEKDSVLYVDDNFYGEYAIFPAKGSIVVNHEVLEEQKEQLYNGEYDYLLIGNCLHSFMLEYRDNFEGEAKDYAMYKIVFEGDDVRFRLLGSLE